jgi:hypothetical protein
LEDTLDGSEQCNKDKGWNPTPQDLWKFHKKGGDMATIIEFPRPFDWWESKRPQQRPRRTINLIELANALELVEAAGYDLTVPPGFCDVCGAETDGDDSVCPDCENWIFN